MEWLRDEQQRQSGAAQSKGKAMQGVAGASQRGAVRFVEGQRSGDAWIRDAQQRNSIEVQGEAKARQGEAVRCRGKAGQSDSVRSKGTAMQVMAEQRKCIEQLGKELNERM